MEKDTTIKITEKTWNILKQMKKRGETFDTVINKLLGDPKTSKKDVEKLVDYILRLKNA